MYNNSNIPDREARQRAVKIPCEELNLVRIQNTTDLLRCDPDTRIGRHDGETNVRENLKVRLGALRINKTQ